MASWVDTDYDPHLSTKAAPEDQFVLATYNVHNSRPLKGKDDAQRDRAKLRNLLVAVRAINGGRGPDVLAMQELSADVAIELLDHLDHQHVAFEGPNAIGVSLFSRFPFASPPKAHWVRGTERPILETTLDVDGEPVGVFVNHWPQSTGTAGRFLASDVLVDAIQMAKAAGVEKIASVGDYNASNGSSVFGARGLSVGHSLAVPARLYDSNAVLAASLVGRDAAIEPISQSLVVHTIGRNKELFATSGGEKRQRVLDHIFLSPALAQGPGVRWVQGSTRVHRPYWLLDELGNPLHVGADPESGVSDHLAVVTRLQRGDRSGSQ